MLPSISMPCSPTADAVRPLPSARSTHSAPLPSARSTHSAPVTRNSSESEIHLARSRARPTSAPHSVRPALKVNSARTLAHLVQPSFLSSTPRSAATATRAKLGRHQPLLDRLSLKALRSDPAELEALRSRVAPRQPLTLALQARLKQLNATLGAKEERIAQLEAALATQIATAPQAVGVEDNASSQMPFDASATSSPCRTPSGDRPFDAGAALLEAFAADSEAQARAAATMRPLEGAEGRESKANRQHTGVKGPTASVARAKPVAIDARRKHTPPCAGGTGEHGTARTAPEEERKLAAAHPPLARGLARSEGSERLPTVKRSTATMRTSGATTDEGELVARTKPGAPPPPAPTVPQSPQPAAVATTAAMTMATTIGEPASEAESDAELHRPAIPVAGKREWPRPSKVLYSRGEVAAAQAALTARAEAEDWFAMACRTPKRMPAHTLARSPLQRCAAGATNVSPRTREWRARISAAMLTPCNPS